MTPHNRMKLYAQISAAAAIVVWGLLCFVIAVAPRMGRLRRVQADLSTANKQLQEMRKEIENASIIGTPGPGESRYEKFGILGADEEQLFLGDLIDFCKETRNTLNVVRRADVARSATQTAQEGQRKAGPTGTPSSGRGQAAQDRTAATPQPIIEKVPHTVNYSGTFLSSFFLLRKLESYKRLLTVERVEVATDTRVGYPRVNGNVTIDLYLVRNPGQPASTSAERTGQPPSAEQPGGAAAPAEGEAAP